MSARTAVRRPVSAGLGRLMGSPHLLTLGAAVGLLWLVGPALVLTWFTAFRGPADALPFEPSAFFTIRNITNIYSEQVLQRTFVDTATFALGSTALAFTVAMALAWLVERTDLPFRNLIYVAVLTPIVLPPIINTVTWIQMWSPVRGLLNVGLRELLFLPIEKGPVNIFTMYGMVMVQGIGQVPVLFIFLTATLRSMDPVFEEASRASGASFLKTVRMVTIPMLRPGILGVILIGIIFAVETFEVPILLAYGAKAQIFSTYVWYGLNPQGGGLPEYGRVAAVGLHFMMLTYALFFVYAHFTRQAARYATVTGRGFRPRPYNLGNWRWAAFVGCVLYLGLVVLMPVLTLIWLSLLPAYMVPSRDALDFISLSNYRALFDDRRLAPAVLNTLIVAVGAASLATTVSMLIAWTVGRARVTGVVRTALDMATSSSVAIPSIVAATAFFLFYISLPLPIVGTLAALVIVYAYRTTVSYRIQLAGITQIGKELEEVSLTSGASPVQTLGRIILPLLAPSFFSAWILLFILAFREFTLPMVMNTGGRPWVLGILVWLLQGSQLTRAMALGVLMTVFLVFVTLFVRVYLVARLRRGAG